MLKRFSCTSFLFKLDISQKKLGYFVLNVGNVIDFFPCLLQINNNKKLKCFAKHMQKNSHAKKYLREKRKIQ